MVCKSFCSQKKVIKAFATKTKTITRFLKKEFKPICEKYNQIDYIPKGPIPKIIWVLWWQGEENMPDIPKACLKSLRKWASGWDIRTLTEKNYQEYVNLDDVLKFRNQYFKGRPRLTIQYMSDLIRTRLLYKYGGIWIDATMFVSNDRIFRLIDTLPFFTIKLDDSLLDDPSRNNSYFTPGRGSFCDSFWASVPGNPFFAFINECMTYHISHHKRIWDYFIIEYSILIGESDIPFFHNILEKCPYSNPDLYWLERNINSIFDSQEWNKVCTDSSFFKVNWRIKRTEENKNKLFFDYIIEQAQVL